MLGFVKVLNSKSGKTKQGKPWTLWSMIMENQDGSESGWVSIGFEKPSFQEGQWANYATETTPKGLNLTAFERAEAPATPVAASSSPTAAGTNSYVDKQATIVYQSSRKDALSLVALLLEHDGLPMSTSAAKAGMAKRFEEIKAFVDKLTVEYFNDVQSLRLLRSVVDAGEAAKPAEPASGAVQDDND